MLDPSRRLCYDILARQEVIILETIANRIMAIVEATGGNMSEFGRRIGVTPAYISKFKYDETRVPSNRTISDICREFGVDEHWLRTGEGEMLRRVPEGEALAAQLGQLLRDVDADFKRRLISELLRLPPEAWAKIEDFARRVTAEDKEKEEAGQ